MKSNTEWKKWGEIDPLFGVATWTDKARNGASPWVDDEFFALGKTDWEDFKRHWVQYGFNAGTCLEIGCGAGRITKYLAVDFEYVRALDVSDGMIKYARSHIPDSNVEFLVCDGAKVPNAADSFDAVFSSHVFQHFDELREASNYFHEIFRVLKKQGSLMVHLPIYRWPSHDRFFNTLLNIAKGIGNAKAMYYRSRIKRGTWYPFMRRLSYDFDWLYQTLDQIGFADVEFRIIRPRSSKNPHPFVLARKAS